MDTNNTNEPDITTYKGTPEEVGTKLFLDALGPTLKDIMGEHGPERCARVYAGILAGYAGVMLQDFGPQAVVEILRGTADNIERSIASGEIQAGGH